MKKKNRTAKATKMPKTGKTKKYGLVDINNLPKGTNCENWSVIDNKTGKAPKFKNTKDKEYYIQYANDKLGYVGGIMLGGIRSDSDFREMTEFEEKRDITIIFTPPKKDKV